MAVTARSFKKQPLRAIRGGCFRFKSMEKIVNSEPPSADDLLKEVRACFLTKKVPGKYAVGDMYARYKREIEPKIKEYLGEAR